MGRVEVVGMLLIALNVAVTFLAFRNESLFEKLLFETGEVLKKGQWYRLLTAGFIHVSWSHLFFNMITLYFFAGSVERELGVGGFLIVYIVSLLGGNLLALLLHQKNDRYRAVGASGAVSGVVYAAIALFSDMELAFIFVPIPFPAWIYGIGFILYSIYGVGSQRDNIGHEAHLGGAVLGLLMAVLLHPPVLQENLLVIGIISLPVVVFLVLIATGRFPWGGNSHH